MGTTLTIILATVIVTVVIISLGLGIWVIAGLIRRISTLGGLCDSYRKELDNIYIQFERVNNNHENTIKELNQGFKTDVNDIHDRIEGVIHENERNLDRRFDKVYRKINELSPNTIGVLED
jgi:hypothetical protein